MGSKITVSLPVPEDMEGNSFQLHVRLFEEKNGKGVYASLDDFRPYTTLGLSDDGNHVEIECDQGDAETLERSFSKYAIEYKKRHDEIVSKLNG